jgi:glycosyltransferase involved in cell wall biosynthesis
VFTTSEDDREVLARELPGLRASVVPNGVDLERFTRRAGAPADRAGAVFVGKMDYRPNVDAAVWFCDEVLPRVRERDPEFRFTIVGAEPAPAVRALGKRRGVEVTGFVDDTRPYLESAALAVAPLRSGSGTRLKILEALAMETPVVTTTTGAEGIDARDGEHLWREDDPAAFADRVVEVAAGDRAAEAVGRAGRELVERRYGWKAIAASAAETVASLTRKAKAAALA